MLAAEAFSPHETHFCVLGSGIGLGDFVRALRGLMLLGIGGCCLLILRLRESWLPESFREDLVCYLFVVQEAWMKMRNEEEFLL